MPRENFTANSDQAFGPICPLISDYHELRANGISLQIFLWLIVIDAVFAAIGIVSNGVLLLTIWTNPGLHSPSMTLLFCLACTDLLNGVFTQPLAIVYQHLERMGRLDLSCPVGTALESSAWLASGLSASILTAVSVERLVALKLHLRYAEVVTNSRVLSLVLALLVFYLALMVARLLGIVQKTFYLINIPIICLCIVVNIVVYVKIYRIVQHHQRAVISQLQTQENAENCRHRRANVSQIKKSVINFLYVLGFFMISYGPFMGVLLVCLVSGFSSSVKLAYYCTATLVFANSCFNPFLYCWRMQDIRRAVVKTIRKIYTAN